MLGLKLNHVSKRGHWWHQMMLWNFVNFGSSSNLSSFQNQIVIKTNADGLTIRPIGTNFSEIWIRIQTFSFKKIHFKILLQHLSILSRPQCVKVSFHFCIWCITPHAAELILGLRPANESRSYKLTLSLIGWAKNLEPTLMLCLKCPILEDNVPILEAMKMDWKILWRHLCN